MVVGPTGYHAVDELEDVVGLVDFWGGVMLHDRQGSHERPDGWKTGGEDGVPL